MKLALAVLSALPSIIVPANAQYLAVRDGDVVRLSDKKTDTTVSIILSVGAVVFEMKVKGQNIVNFSAASLDSYRQRPGNTGIPFLGPWANRMDEQAFYFNGKKYPFNMDLGNVTGAHPIHGFLSYAPREVVAMKADANSAWLTTRLEVWRNPSWMAQFPFAHTVEGDAAAAERRARNRNQNRKPEHGNHAAGDRLSSLFPTHRFTPR